MRDITIMQRFVGGEIMLSIEKLYQILYQNMGPQYWWPAETPIEMMLGAPTQRISTRNSTDKASWGWGPNTENFNEKFYRQSKLGLNILIDLIQSCLFSYFVKIK